jgi:hypothetical protein
MIKSTKHIKNILFITLTCGFIFLYLISFAQENKINGNGLFNTSIEASFLQKEVVIVKGQIISNVLRIKNSSEQPISLYANLNFPSNWKTLFNSDKLYTIPAMDSIFIPVRIIPAYMMFGNTKYYINVFIEDENRSQIAMDYFFGSTKKISQWELKVNPDTRIYFKNNENTAAFDIKVLNTGNENQDLMLTMAKSRYSLIVMDSTGKAVTDFKHDFSLDPKKDTTFNYTVKYVEGERNFKNIDIENYNPAYYNEEKQYSLYFHSEEPRRFNHSNISRNAKVDFVNLVNDNKVNPFGSDVLPLSAYLRVSNLLEDVVFSSLHLRGQKYFNNGGTLLYNTSLYFSSQENFYGDNYVKNIPWYIGYFDDKKSIQAGYVNGGAIGVQSSGKGIKGEIKFLPDNWAGGYYIRSPYFFEEARLESYGFHHRIELDNFSNLTQYSHSHHKSADMITDVISVSPKFRLKRKHTINFTGALSNRYSYIDPSNTNSRQGYLAGAGYSSYFFQNKWKLNIRGSYTSKGFGAYGFERWFVNHHSSFTIRKDFELMIVNNYNQYKYDPQHYNYITGYDNNYFFFNSLNLYSSKYFRSVTPGIFYDIRNNLGYNFHSRGFNLSYSKYNINENLQFSLINTIGFSRIINQPVSDEHFMYKLNTMIRYHNWGFIGFYNYGPTTPAMIYMKIQNNIMPQNLRVSLSHQYMFGNRHLVLQSMLSYMFTNIYNHHSINYSPELFYFTNSGWRFSINPVYTLYSSKFTANYVNLPDYIADQDYDFQRYTHDNFTVSIGVKKDFGIPIPTTFNEFSNIGFTTFYDVNGNKVQDENEPGIENIHIRVGNWSMITSTTGKANLKNANHGSYEFAVNSLVDLKGWFPLVSDSLPVYLDEDVNIPFVKGAKIYGSVFIDQEKIVSSEEKKTDISGIKISATNGKTFNTLTGADGSFEFYLPFGEYIISLDETILNGRYYIMKNNYKINLDGQVENMYISFNIYEKKRKVRVKKFDGTETEGEN